MSDFIQQKSIDDVLPVTQPAQDTTVSVQVKPSAKPEGSASVAIPARSQLEKQVQSRSNAKRVARLISLILHPFLISPLSIVILLYLDAGSLLAALGWAGLCAAFVVAPGILYIRQKLRTKQFSDADVSVREQRHGFYLFGAVCMAICFGVLLWLDAPSLLISLFIAALFSVTTFAIVTRLWTKVSIHAGVMAGVAVAVAFYSLPLALLLGLGTLLVSWARLVLRRHTALQAVLGWVIAAVCVVGVFLPML